MAGYGKQKPSKKLSQEEKQNIVKRVRENIEDCWNFERDNRREAEIDLQFDVLFGRRFEVRGCGDK